MKIVFCHNVYVRYNILFETLKIEKQLFPESHSIVAYNDIAPPSYVKQFKDVTFIPFKGKTHKIGCTNGCIVSIKEALKHDPDVIVFSHDDVFISKGKLNIFNDKVQRIIDGKSEFICRIPWNKNNTYPYGENYYMMECFFISGKAAKEHFANLETYESEDMIPRDNRGSISPEVFLYIITKNIEKKDVIIYDHKLEGYNETLEGLMGHHHLNAGKRGWI